MLTGTLPFTASDPIEWVQIKVTSPMQDLAVLRALKSIHVPGEKTEHGYRVFGYAEPGKAVDYFS